jgi:hypothetical protein
VSLHPQSFPRGFAKSRLTLELHEPNSGYTRITQERYNTVYNALDGVRAVPAYLWRAVFSVVATPIVAYGQRD